MVSDDVQSVIDGVIREQLGTDHVVSVQATRDEDDEFAEDDLLWVTVVVEDCLSDDDLDNETGIVRHLRPRLKQIGEMAFPVISYMSRAEVEEVT